MPARTFLANSSSVRHAVSSGLDSERRDCCGGVVAHDTVATTTAMDTVRMQPRQSSLPVSDNPPILKISVFITIEGSIQFACVIGINHRIH